MSSSVDHILFVDLEVSPEGKRLLDAGATLGQGEWHSAKLDELRPWLDKAAVVAGHNLVRHDAPFLLKRLGDEVLQAKPLLDTLGWSALVYADKPYHKLVKGYQLQDEDAVSNPLSDAKLCKRLLEEMLGRFGALDDGLKRVYWHLLHDKPGYAPFFTFAGYVSTDPDDAAIKAIQARFAGQLCETAEVEHMAQEHPVELAHVLALMSTADDASVLPPWVVHALPVAQDLLYSLRFKYCGRPSCTYCSERLDPHKALQAHFNYSAFRRFEGDTEPGIQERAVRAALEGHSLLTVFPTGGGKSLTFQLPALMQGELTRSLTVVISPLVSLMKDQVEVLEERFQNVQAAHLSGLLSPLERKEVLERVEQGGIHLLYIAPETLRNPTLTRLLQRRHIARFVIDEAHCFSAWGHDFRVDYLYIGPFLKQLQEDKQLVHPIPVSCFTATAKPQVVEDIIRYFKEGLGLELDPFISHARRENLRYEVIPLHDADADTRKRALLKLVHECERPAIVYVSRTKRVEDLAAMLEASGLSVRAYHGKMKREEKQANQDAFMKGDAEVMVATNAFGMGVDKEDVRTVIHYNISASLESYVQEAGRAGRKKEIEARCCILYHESDLGGHFQLLNRSKLNQQEIDQVWRALKRLTKFRDKVSKSALELAIAAGWDTEIKDLNNRVTASLAALEDRGYVQRTLNSPRVFATGLLMKDLEAALKKVNAAPTLTAKQKENCARVLQRIIKSEETRVDALAEQLGMPLKQVVATIQHLRELQVLNDAQDLSAFVDMRPRAGSRARFERIAATEKALVGLLPAGPEVISLRALNQGLIDKGIDAQMNEVLTLLRYWKSSGFVRTRRVARTDHSYRMEPRSEPAGILRDIEQRHSVALAALDHLLERATAKAEEDKDKEERLAEFSLLGMQQALNAGLFAEQADAKTIQRALLFLNETRVIQLEDGFMVIYQRLNVARLNMDNRKRYTAEDYGHLRLHYQNRVEQIHMVGEYARQRTNSAQAALAYVDDYFKLDHKAFVRKYFRGRDVEITRSVTRERFAELMGDLDLSQAAIVSDGAPRILVEAGPGSGKTRVLVHKVANLLLLEDVKPEQFLMLTFSKAAAMEFRRRVYDLVPEYRGLITVTTFHGFCFDLLGQLGDLDKSEKVITRAIQAIEQREVDLSAVANKSVIVLDEFQDVDAEQWRLVQAIAKVAEEPRIIAVGDDDQIIYRWRGASPEYMAAFRSQYKASEHNLLTNYRSKGSLVQLTAHLVGRVRHRMKAGKPMVAKDDTQGVQRVVTHAGGFHLQGLVDDLLAQRYPGTTAVLTRTNEQAILASAMLQQRGVHARHVGGSDDFDLARTRELRAFDRMLHAAHGSVGIIPKALWEKVRNRFLERLEGNKHRADLCDLIARFEQDAHGRIDPGEWSAYIREIRIGDVAQAKGDTVFVSTMHKSKGREFTNVFVHLDGFPMHDEEELRLLYVACTRAMERLVIHTNAPFLPDYIGPLVRETVDLQHPWPARLEYVLNMREVNLGSCWFARNSIKGIKTSEQLAPTTKQFADGDSPGLGRGGESLLLFSQKFRNETLPRFDRLGYRITGGSVEYIVEWHNEKQEARHEVVLPRVVLERE
jgi:ATP-dependent DNA helicase RecQ